MNYRQDIFNKDFEIYHNNSLTVYLEGRNNTVLKTLTGIRYEITDLLYLNLSVGYDYEQNPPVGAEIYDLALLFGLGLEY